MDLDEGNPRGDDDEFNLEMSGTTVCFVHTNSGEPHQRMLAAISTDKFLEIIAFQSEGFHSETLGGRLQ